MTDQTEELAAVIRSAPVTGGYDVDLSGPLAKHLLDAGYRKPRTITAPEEANALPDRSIILTPGKIAFQKWEGYYSKGKDAWERELGGIVPAELLSADAHFPATVLYEPEARS